MLQVPVGVGCQLLRLLALLPCHHLYAAERLGGLVQVGPLQRQTLVQGLDLSGQLGDLRLLVRDLPRQLVDVVRGTEDALKRGERSAC